MREKGCKEERDAVLYCYRKMRGRSAGDIVFECEAPVNKLVECSELVRIATIDKIVAGSLPSDTQS